MAVGGRGPIRASRRYAPASVGLPAGDYASVYYPVAQNFVGTWLADLFKILIITGSFACSLAFWNTSNRYLFSMGRESILPRVFGRTHSKHKSPFVATVFVALFCIVFTLLFATGLVGGGQREALGIGVSNPLVALLQIGTWIPFQGNLLLFPIMAIVQRGDHGLLPEKRAKASTGSRRLSPRFSRRRRSSSPST